ncbi:MAG: aminotransferase class V-fold PLP-dependent enzyme [Corallococcus sp.]|nr:aminotransferase class V-fold PLP-dependent enzyme [Corallococcus sp.]MCM1359299.1 aminotransferase class V-fold PLP-dependent enzyme [Corallococcus sp.]MCM1394890.1 aminotransferase class V-fold PLP-dependent enzyme [Corallococcus sp.]
MIYLDNAATTNYKPKSVLDAVHECLTKYPFNPNRGNNKYALALQQKLLDVRKKLSLLYKNDSEMHVVFTSGCTAALNLAILGNAKRGHIVISATEHNSVLRPVMQLKKKGYVTVSLVQPDENGQITLESVQKVWKPNTYMLCVSHASNVTGQKQNLAGLGAFVRQKNALFLVDCAQSAGYFAADMERDGIDLIAIGAHKGLHAVQGAGALIFNERSAPRPITFGGTGTESHLYFQPQTLPDSLESGTLPTPAIVAMGAGLDFWIENWERNEQNVKQMQQIILKGLESIPDVLLYSLPNKSGIAAFNVGNADSTTVADALLEKFDIVVRGGLQCAPLMHKYLGTFEQGIVRASVSCVTDKTECYTLLNAVEDTAKRMKG